MSAAAQSTEFYTTFVDRLKSLQESIEAASTSESLDQIIHGVIESRDILQAKDLEGHLSKRDKEQYEKRLKDIQACLSIKRSSLEGSSSSGAKTGQAVTFSFRRNNKMKSTPSDLAQTVPASGIPTAPPTAEPIPSGQAAQAHDKLQQATPAGIQVTLQSQRFFSFEDLPNASNGSDGFSLSLSHLTECVLDFRTPPKPIVAIHATNLSRCILLLPEIQGSAQFGGLKDSYLVLPGCRQFRIHASSETWIFLRSLSPATLEACSKLFITSVGTESSATASTSNLLASGDSVPSQVRPEILVQDFESPESGVSSKGSKSWFVPDETRRGIILDSILNSASQASRGENHWLRNLQPLDKTESKDSKPPQESLYRSSDSGILLVFSDPGSQATLEEFHDWYDNEHVPLRTLRFPEFRSAGRYEVISSPKSPCETSPSFKAGWAAAYTISNNQLYAEERYSGLRQNRSKREGELLSRVATLDRRIYTLLVDSKDLNDSKGDTSALSADELRKESSSVYFIGFDTTKITSANEVKDWFKSKVLPQLSNLTIQRSRLLTLVDALINGKSATPSNGDAKYVGKWCLYLESAEKVFSHQKEIENLLEQCQWEEELGVKDVEVRVMSIYRAWDPVKALEAVETRSVQ
ncbi:unnamed protein product [Sympodiomycopsis kandeliae]